MSEQNWVSSGNPGERWAAQGIQRVIPGEVNRLPEYDPRSGDHLWTINLAYRWGGPHIETPILDKENLLLIAGPACYHCEQGYSDRLFKRRCPGDPKR